MLLGQPLIETCTKSKYLISTRINYFNYFESVNDCIIDLVVDSNLV